MDLNPLVRTRSGTNKIGSKLELDLKPKPSFRNDSSFRSSMVLARNRPVCNPSLVVAHLIEGHVKETIQIDPSRNRRVSIEHIRLAILY